MILICSASSTVRQRWLEGAAVCGQSCEAHTISDIELRLAEHNPQLVLVHLALPGLDGARGVAVLRKKFPHPKLIIFTDVPNEEEGLALLKLGVHGYANTYMSPELLVRAIHAVNAGEVWAGRMLIQRLIADMARPAYQAITQKFSPALEGLTGREKEIALLIGKASNNKSIAKQLNLTERTVKAHLSSIFRKTGTQDRLHLALLVSSQLAEDTSERPVLSS